MKRIIIVVCTFLVSILLSLVLVDRPVAEAGFLPPPELVEFRDEGISDRPQDKITVSLGKRLMNLDDVRLGDYSIREDDELVSVAHEELEATLRMLLTMKGKELPHSGSRRGAINNLKQLERLYRSIFPQERRRAAPPNTLWDQEDQVFLDALISQQINSLQGLTANEEEKSLLFYLHARHLIATKREKEGEAILKTLSRQTTAGAYQMRAAGELVFRSFLKKDYRSVIENSHEILRNYPNTRASQDAHYFLGRAYHMSNSHDLAVTHFDRLISRYRSNKWNEGAKYFRAKSHYFQRNWTTAIVQFEDFIASYPRSVYKDDARELIARAYAQNQQFDKAIQAFEAYKQENTSVLDQMVADRHIYLYAKPAAAFRRSSGDNSGARYFESLAASYENKLLKYLTDYASDHIVIAQGMFDLSQYYLNNGQPDKAIQYLERLKDEKFSTSRGPRKRGDRSEEHYGKIHAFQISYNLARAYLEMGNTVRVQSIKEEFAKSNNLHYYYLIRLAEIRRLEQRGRRNEAMREYQALYDDTNTSPRIKATCLFQIGNVYFSLQMREEAKKSFQRLVDEFPNTPLAQNARNMVSFLSSRPSTHPTSVPHLKK
jgi:TolA-binding protein